MGPNWIKMSDAEINALKLWTVEFSPLAIGALKTMSRRHAGLLFGFIARHLQAAPNPRAIGKPLRCRSHYLWRYRIGDYRLICQLDQKRMAVIIITIQSSFCNLIEMDDEMDME